METRAVIWAACCRIWPRRPSRPHSSWPPGVHALRHTCAALLIAQGAHPKAIQSHLGHRSITTTLDRYGHLFEDEHEKLAERIDAAYAELVTKGDPGQITRIGEVS